MTLAKIRQTDSITSWWSKVYYSAKFEPILTMLQEEHPLRIVDDRTRFSNDASAHRMGFIEGYELALLRLRLAGEQLAPEDEPLEATFEPAKPTSNKI